jgi:hypothetical protein
MKKTLCRMKICNFFTVLIKEIILSSSLPLIIIIILKEVLNSGEEEEGSLKFQNNQIIT